MAPATPDGLAPHVLRDDALVADGHRAALSGPRGYVAWLRAPGWDDEAVLAPLIGGGGTFTVAPRTAASGAGTTRRGPRCGATGGSGAAGS